MGDKNDRPQSYAVKMIRSRYYLSVRMTAHLIAAEVSKARRTSEELMDLILRESNPSNALASEYVRVQSASAEAMLVSDNSDACVEMLGEYRILQLLTEGMFPWTAMASCAFQVDVIEDLAKHFKIDVNDEATFAREDGSVENRCGQCGEDLDAPNPYGKHGCGASHPVAVPGT